MDAAAAARMSDPLLNPHFSRRWHEHPVPRAAVTHLVVADTPPPATAQRERLDHLAALLLAEHRRRQAEGAAP